MNDFYKNLIFKGEKIAVAVSGGSDSVALLHFLCERSKTDGFFVCAVNIEHGIRGEDSLKDSAFVKDFCKKLGVELYFYRVDSLAFAEKERISVEQAARILRYQKFRELLESGAVDKLATAHHESDNAETVLLNLFRGASLKGAAGIKPVNERIVRPFLYTSKREIEEYLHKHALAFVEDKTNGETDILRNYVRHRIMPEIRSAFPDAEGALSRFAALARAEDEFLDSLALPFVGTEGGVAEVKLGGNPVLLKRALALALKETGLRKDYTNKHIEAAAALAQCENGAQADLPCGYVAKREYKKIVIFKKDGDVYEKRPFSYGKFEFCGRILTVEKSSLAEFNGGCGKEGVFFADEDKICKSAVVRTRKEGDVFEKFGGGRKKLKSYYIDLKYPARLRSKLLLIAEGGEILFSGLDVSQKIKVDKSTVNVVKLTYNAQRSF